MANAKRDENRVPTLIGVSSSDAITPLLLHVDPATNRLLVSAVITGGSSAGTEYTEGDTDASITGSAILWEDTSDTLRSVSAAKPLPVNVVAGGAGDGAILDGVSSSIKATVFDYTNSNPLGVVLRDTNGDYVSVGGGTQYATNVAYADANVGTLALTIRDDALAALTEADGDYSGLRVTSTGALWTTFTNSTIAVTATDLDIRNLVNTDVVTAELSAIDNAVLDAIAASVAAIDVDATTIIGHVDGIETALTAANSSLDAIEASVAAIDTDATTIIGHVDGIETALTAANASLDAIEASVAAIDTDTSTIIGHLDGVEGLLTTIAGDTTDIEAAIELIDDTIFTAGTDTYTEATSKGQLMLAVRRDADTTLANTTNEFVPFQVDANGALKVEAFSGETLPVSLTSTTITGTVAVTQSGTWDEVGINDSGNSITVDSPVGTPTFVRLSDGSAAIATLPVSLATVPSHAVTNAGTFAVQVDGSALTALQLLDDTIFTDDAAFTPATSKVGMAGFQADETATDSVDEGDAGAARMTLDRKQIVTPQPHTAGGLAIHRSIDLDEGTLEVVKNAPGQVYGMWVTNTATSTRFIKFYNATSGTLGTGTPVLTIPVPGNTSDDITGVFNVGGMGVEFTTGICVGAGTGVADADTGAPAANDVIVNIFYK